MSVRPTTQHVVFCMSNALAFTVLPITLGLFYCLFVSRLIFITFLLDGKTNNSEIISMAYDVVVGRVVEVLWSSSQGLR